jgi:hypothetical protein
MREPLPRIELGSLGSQQFQIHIGKKYRYDTLTTQSQDRVEDHASGHSSLSNGSQMTR